ncbi:MAG: hypothetical protein EOO61_14205 [Hymenobacter sp.]|nr:MAG: hypothetical protein EOO61_14205 [Hymenobacter sp.]
MSSFCRGFLFHNHQFTTKKPDEHFPPGSGQPHQASQEAVRPVPKLRERPANLSRTLNRLMFENLRLGGTVRLDEAENLNALFDFLLACQVASTTTFLLAAE